MQRLCKDADQTFLWATLVLDMLDDSTRASEEALDGITKDLPRDLDDIYTKLLSQSSDIEMARKILHIVVAAFRPLTLQEINIALAIHPDDSSIAQVRRKLDPSIDHALRRICGPIIRITDSKVALVHLTAKSFLLRGSLHPLASAKAWEQPLTSVESHTLLADVCTQISSFGRNQNDCILNSIYQIGSEEDPDDEDRPARVVDTFTRRYGFLDYSANHWTRHYRLGERNELAPRAGRLCSDQGDSYYNWFYVYAIASSMWAYQYRELSTLMVASYFGLEEVAARMIRWGCRIDETDDEDWTALIHAACSGSERNVKMLLDHGADVNAIGEPVNAIVASEYTPLWAAGENGHAEIVQLLIGHGAQLSGVSEMALSMAAAEGHESVVATLLENGCDIEERDSEGQVPIHHACLNGRADMFKFLVSRGADVFAKDIYDRTSLAMAAESGAADIVSWMLSKGADVNGTDCFGTTAFDLAQWFGHFDVLRILVDHGAKDPYLGNIDDYHDVKPREHEESYNRHLRSIRGPFSQGMDIARCFPWIVRKLMVRPDGKGGFEENPDWQATGQEFFQEFFD
jgi:ankyrin repeat protein